MLTIDPCKMLLKMLTHKHTSSTLCGYQLGSKGEVSVEKEKEMEAQGTDRTLVIG